MKTLRTTIPAIALVAVIYLNACNQIDFSRILLADSDAWNGSSSLGASLPGPPIGDRAENIEHVTQENIEEISGDSFRVAGQIDFIPIFHQDATEYMISWHGFRTLLGNTASTTITFMDQSDRIAFRIILDATTGHLIVEAGSPSPSPTWSGALAHEFSITMQPTISRFDFLFEEENCNENDDCLDWNNLQYLDPDFDTLSRIRFEGGEYYLDDLSVFLKPPL